MKQKRKYRKRRVTAAADEKVTRDIVIKITGLIDDLVTAHYDQLKAVRLDLIRARDRIREKKDDAREPGM